MRFRRLSSVLAATAVLGGAAACGVAADTTAATISGTAISTSDVDRLATDQAFLALVGQTPGEGDSESRVSGPAARSALGFELERVAYVNAAKDLGLEADSSITDEAQMWVAQQEAQLGMQGAGDGATEGFDDFVTSKLTSYVEAQLTLYNYVSTASAEDDTLVRRLYERLSGRWDQRCVTIVGAGADDVDRVRELRASGAGVEQIADEVEQAEIVVDARTACVARVDLPIELVEAIDSLRVGSTGAPVEVSGAVYVVRLEGRRQVSLDEARAELAQMLQAAAQSGPQALIAGDLATAAINPRYGSSATSEGMVLPPQTPIVTAPELDIELPGA